MANYGEAIPKVAKVFTTVTYTDGSVTTIESCAAAQRVEVDIEYEKWQDVIDWKSIRPISQPTVKALVLRIHGPKKDVDGAIYKATWDARLETSEE